MSDHPHPPCEPRWHQGARERHRLPEALRDWLLDESSLTRRLQQACAGRFRVELIALGWGRPLRNEAQALGVRPWQRALIRQVRLWCDDQPWVVARTVIPMSSLQGAQRRLAHLGSRPLGAFLFADPTLRRSPLQVTQLGADDPLLAGSGAVAGPVWGRRSVFHLRGHPLLVSEFFLPGLPSFGARVDHA